MRRQAFAQMRWGAWLCSLPTMLTSHATRHKTRVWRFRHVNGIMHGLTSGAVALIGESALAFWGVISTADEWSAAARRHCLARSWGAFVAALPVALMGFFTALLCYP